MAIDAAWMRRERNVRLGTKFGGDGLTVMLCLWLMAKEQRDEGKVKLGYVSLARAAFVESPERVEEIVRFAAEIGAVSRLDDDSEVVELELADFANDDARGTETVRKQAQRSATRRPATGRDKPGLVPHREEESREEKRRDDPSSLRSEGSLARAAGAPGDAWPDRLSASKRAVADPVDAGPLRSV